MDLREILFAQFPAFFLLSLLFLIAHLRVRKHSAVKSVLWVLLFACLIFGSYGTGYDAQSFLYGFSF